MRLSQTHPKLAKEVRPLIPPWIVAVAAGSLIAFSPLAEGAALESLFRGIAVYGFFGGLAFLAALTFGAEFQDRTLSLLLAQPLTRTNLWKRKMLTMATAVFAAAVVEAVLLLGFSGWYSGTEVADAAYRAVEGEQVVLAGMFLLITVCSCCFWTLTARSVLGGLVFTVAAQFFSGLVVAFVCAKVGGLEEPFQNGITSATLVVVGLIYAGVLLWLGRRKFLRLEVRSLAAGQMINESGQPWRRLPWSNLLISRPDHRLLNLIKKEVRLQKPIAQMALIFVLAWAGAVLFQWNWKKQNITYFFDVLACLFAPIGSLLAGCISLGEEKALGLNVTQLTLPISPRTQWLLKLIVSAATAAILCLGLPWLLFNLTGGLIDLTTSGVMNPRDNGMWGLACISGFAFLLAYWAIALNPNTVRGALVAVVGLIVGGTCVALGIWFSNRSGSLERGLFTAIMCHWQLPPNYLAEHLDDIIPVLSAVLIGLVAIILLRQSFKQFRVAEAGVRRLLQYSFSVATVIFLLSAWMTDCGSAIYQLPNSQPVMELKQAIKQFADGQFARDGAVPATELGGNLSDQTQAWLRNAVIRYNHIAVGTFKGEARETYQISILFPNDLEYSFLGDPVSR